MTRFIPVYTGNIAVNSSVATAASVYPCVYREHVADLRFCKNHHGLSLCIQGTWGVTPPSTSPSRFIPVYTGNMLSHLSVKNILTVYPCVYREHNRSYNADLINSGLSLCIQGTSYAFPLTHECLRFIPVYTGNIPIITYCFIIKILTVKFLPIFWDIFYQNQYL